jgi:hypothetical protein
MKKLSLPDRAVRIKLVELFDVQHTIGIVLTESLAMYPASSVCGWYIAHPESNYFGIGKIQQNQLVDYVMRKEMSLEKMECWISPNLDYLFFRFSNESNRFTFCSNRMIRCLSFNIFSFNGFFSSFHFCHAIYPPGIIMAIINNVQSQVAS